MLSRRRVSLSVPDLPLTVRTKDHPVYPLCKNLVKIQCCKVASIIFKHTQSADNQKLGSGGNTRSGTKVIDVIYLVLIQVTSKYRALQCTELFSAAGLETIT